MMEKLQRFGGAMMAPVMIMPFAGIMIGFATIFTNVDIMGNLAADTTLWYRFWSMMYDGGCAIFNQLPLLFIISLPIGLARKATGKAAMESFVIFLIFNYFVQSLLTFFGADLFNVDFAQEVGGTSGLTMIAGIKTLDMSVIGAILIAGISVWIHNRWYEKKLPSVLSSFQGSALIVIIGFVLMIPLAFVFCWLWPIIQHGILSLQEFLSESGNLGVFLFTFLERITIPTGLHHFLWTPFDLGPAVITDGSWTHWMANVNEFVASTQPLKAVNKNYDKLNKSDLHNIAIILDNAHAIANMNIEELAKLCNTSKSTISRLIQKLGFSGYSEFKNYVKWENQGDLKTQKKHYKQNIKNDFLSTCQQMNTSSDLKEVAHKIETSQNVVIYGTGQAQRYCAMEMQRLFMQVNKYMYYVGASDEFCMLSKTLGPNDLMIVISLSGNINKIKDTLQLLHLKKVKTVSITNLQNNPLLSKCDYSLYAISSPVELTEQLIHNLFVNFLTVIEYIFLSYLEIRIL